MILMSKFELLTMGEVIDKIESDKIAISIHPDDECCIVTVDNENWLMIKHPSKNYFDRVFSFQKSESVKEKRWIILKKPEGKLTDMAVDTESFRKEVGEE